VGNWKYFEAPEEDHREIYHLGHDPDERTDLSRYAGERMEKLSARIREWRRSKRGGFAESGLSPGDRAALEALGYGASEAATGSDAESAPMRRNE
jgi:hypothetical protein